MSPIQRKGRILEKVTAFVTRKSANGPELLVFRHPTAGVQLPAGTVEIGEAVEAAVLRELHEEAGLQQVELVRLLATLDSVLSGDWRLVLRPTKLFTEPASDASSTGFLLQRGSWVWAGATAGAFIEVVYEEHDLTQKPPRVIKHLSGWVRTSVLTNRLRRYFFHLKSTVPTAETWTVPADGHVFELYWTPLVPRPELVRGQNEWLEHVYEELLV